MCEASRKAAALDVMSEEKEWFSRKSKLDRGVSACKRLKLSKKRFEEHFYYV